MANGWGGARAGAGRKRKSEKYAAEIEAAEKKVKDRLPDLIDNLFLLAQGGYPINRVKRGLLEGKMVVVEEVTETAPPDRKANEYLVDRIMGRPTQEVEMDLEHSGEIRIPDALTDDERAARLAALLDAARARRDGLGADRAEGA